MTTTQLLHPHDCDDDETIVSRAVDAAMARALREGRHVPTSGRPPAWLVAMIDEAIADAIG